LFYACIGKSYPDMWIFVRTQGLLQVGIYFPVVAVEVVGAHIQLQFSETQIAAALVVFEYLLFVSVFAVTGKFVHVGGTRQVQSAVVFNQKPNTPCLLHLIRRRSGPQRKKTGSKQPYFYKCLQTLPTNVVSKFHDPKKQVSHKQMNKRKRRSA
jgi:hypothetical protein